MNSRARLNRVTTLVASSLLLLAGLARASPGGRPPAAASSMTVSFKLDPRLSGSTYGGERWVSPPTYKGANAQDTVEARVQGGDAKGEPVEISAKWIPSNPKMVVVTPDQGDRVRIAVKSAGESKLKVVSQGLSLELTIKSRYVGNVIQVEIVQPVAGKSAGGAAAPPVPARESHAAAADASPLDGNKAKLSYALGMNLGIAVQRESIEVDRNLIQKGLADALSGSKTLLSEGEGRAAVLELRNDKESKRLAHLRGKKVAEEGKKRGDGFLEENKKKEGVVTLPSGVQYKLLARGHGKKPSDTDVVKCNYRIALSDGTEIDASRPGEPAALSVGGLDAGWRETIKLMPVGSKWQMFLPPEIRYGQQKRRARKRSGGSASFSLPLIYDVELVAIAGSASAGEKTESVAAASERGP